MHTHALRAVFFRNFLYYFTNPTGYLFICLFVFLGTSVHFCLPEFFNANLANLNLLNAYFPWVMLLFVPAITMGAWADERRQGTDELLLTIPASDLDVVLGKYLAAVAIYTVALLFSMACNSTMLALLSQGSLDGGLFLGTYFGYWLVGLSMLAVGMVASFLTGNLTVAYILGAVFNAPLVVAAYSDYVTWPGWVRHIRDWSIGGQLQDFGRGLVSLSSMLYFGMIVAVMLYLSMVLIGRRHWTSGQFFAMVAHYLARTLALAVIAAGLIALFQWHDLRADVTAEQLSSLSRETRELLGNLKVERPVRIEAFISPEVPESYVQTKLNLETALREFDKLGGEKVEVVINHTEKYSKVAAEAEKRYGITPREVPVVERGTMSVDSIFMHVAFTCGLEKVDPVYFDRGIPVEYELVRSVVTVAQQKRKRIGVVTTDAPLFGRFSFQMGSPSSDWPIIEELKKQYEVEQVDLAKPLDEDEKFDALLAVQPSTLGPEQMENLIAAIRSGVPTAIFEDPCPCPFFYSSSQVPATSEERRPPGGMNPMFRQPPPPRGNPQELFEALGIVLDDREIIWQDYNPYKTITQFPPEFVFVDRGALFAGEEPEEEKEKEGAEAETGSVAELFNPASPISSKLQHMLFCFPGAVSRLPSASTAMEFTELVRTGRRTGTVRFGTMPGELFQFSLFGRRQVNSRRRQEFTGEEYVLAVHIRSKEDESKKEKKAGEKDDASADAGPKLEEDEPSPEKINVVFVADFDLLSPEFFSLREQGNIPERDIQFDFDNVTFVLNVLDVLAGDKRFVEIRKRRPLHRTLTLIEKKTKEARRDARDARKDCEDETEKKLDREEEAFRKKIEALKKRKDLDPQQALIQIAVAEQAGQQRLDAEKKRLEAQRDKTLDKIQTDLNVEVDRVQNWYRFWAVFLPPIPPLALALGVFIARRLQESEGVAQARLR